jgi:hypothetical protein
VLLRSGQLNDQPPEWTGKRNGDEYANISEGNILRPMMAKARDMRTKVEINGQEFKFSSASSRDYFVSELGEWFAKNASAKPQGSGAVQVGQQG